MNNSIIGVGGVIKVTSLFAVVVMNKAQAVAVLRKAQVAAELPCPKLKQQRHCNRFQCDCHGQSFVSWEECRGSSPTIIDIHKNIRLSILFYTQKHFKLS